DRGLLPQEIAQDLSLLIMMVHPQHPTDGHAVMRHTLAVPLSRAVLSGAETEDEFTFLGTRFETTLMVKSDYDPQHPIPAPAPNHPGSPHTVADDAHGWVEFRITAHWKVRDPQGRERRHELSGMATGIVDGERVALFQLTGNLTAPPAHIPAPAPIDRLQVTVLPP
ncbi:MAG: hypothetical protein OXT09_20585, partial [Myxococcales bacterium]|nr:hypothetical protein [Myxococcales bacterium]